jgi:hypothetical protein
VIKRIFIIGMCLSIVLGCRDNEASQVRISGEIIYDDFSQGEIEVFWAEKLTKGKPLVKDLKVLPGPGSYSLAVPKDQGEIYILARNRGELRTSYAYFISDPLQITDKDIPDFKIFLKKNQLFMERYSGPVVEISGTLDFPRYVSGKLEVGAYRPETYSKVRLPPDLAKVELSGPGSYRIKVPFGWGKVAVVAVYIPEGERSGNSPLSQHKLYKNGALVVGSNNIENINFGF